ncbi:chaperonin-like RBCX protein 1, chloroplastic [Coffea eugenioides]|uniref:Chaperonin-like RBCX protein 1, chloroplastic isoform X1 n=1 Tax=Coffea arabica TaxID=13443 RepID=A0A6P6UEP1_COFAR|nr:chaperonin-like RBCX protein 1, chloroplastic isoform X1 [Coffea arabica]XP_027089250.1 chaperonin-like RBCX protein 1, chloroplastic isoform X1 [Coffea arabica]XP_027185898.1 chaperonin-like RBCX protein 1, chloroplastic [Coffea eugenioides]
MSHIMESFATVPLSRLAVSPTQACRETRACPFRPWKQRTSQPTRFHCQKMYVPGFGEGSPEAKAAKHLHNFFTYIAVRIVTAQLQSYNPEAYEELMEFLGRHSVNDGDKFCANLMRESPRHKNLAMRILEVRSAYCKNDFEWDNLKRLSHKVVNESNTRLMRDYVRETSHVESEN